MKEGPIHPLNVITDSYSASGKEKLNK